MKNVRSCIPIDCKVSCAATCCTTIFFVLDSLNQFSTGILSSSTQRCFHFRMVALHQSSSQRGLLPAVTMSLMFAVGDVSTSESHMPKSLMCSVQELEVLRPEAGQRPKLAQSVSLVA